jgi:hypothetical protein
MSAITITDLNNAKVDVEHIADIANSEDLTATDRLGRTKKTLEGAIATIAAITPRGAWAQSTAYQRLDAVSNTDSDGQTWWITLDTHTSGSGAFDDDQAAYWHILQGVTAPALAASTGAAQIGTSAGITVQQTLDAESINFRQFLPAGYVTDGSVAYTTEMNTALAYLAANAGVKELVMPRNFTLRLDGAVSMRAVSKKITGIRTPVILAANAAGFVLAGDRGEISGFDFTQSSTALTPTAIYIYNDATTGSSSYWNVHDCTGYNVYRCLDFYMEVNGAGQACYRHTVERCDFSNFYLPQTWSGSYGIGFRGPNSGDAAGNDSKVSLSLVKGYEINYKVQNSIATEFIGCTGDAAGSCFSYEDNSSTMRIIGGYYEYNLAFINVTGGTKYDLYLLYPSYGNNTAFRTGNAISFVAGGMPVGLSFGDINTGQFRSGTTSAIAQISAANGLVVKSAVGETTRLTLDATGLWVFENSEVRIPGAGTFSTDRVNGYTGGGTPMDIRAANVVTLSTGTTARLTVSGTNGDVALNTGQFRIATENTPANATAAGDKGTICWDASYIYVCVSTNTWKRVAIATW